MEESLFFSMIRNDLMPKVFDYVYFLLPIWLPVFLLVMFYQQWMKYVRMDRIKKTKTVLLEIKIPKEITKSPAAMEIIIGALHQAGKTSFFETFWEGGVRPWFSLELVSDGGQIHFYIWTQSKFKNLIESQIYGQYPNVEIFEVEDYTKAVPFTEEYWGLLFKLTKDDAYPIKTYIDYGLDENPKEEHKIDPITSTIEYLGSVKPGHKVWIQIMIKGHRKENFMNDAILFQGFKWENVFKPWEWENIFTKGDWTGDAKKIIEEIREESIPEGGSDEFPKFPNPTKGQQEKIAAIERSLGKLAFDTMIRGMYIWGENPIDPIYISGLIGSFKQYSSQSLNGIRLGWCTDIMNDVTKDILRLAPKFRDSIVRECKINMLDSYKRRLVFYPPYKNFKLKTYILTTEELATIFHFPGQVATTPTFDKIASKKSEPPANLPI